MTEMHDYTIRCTVSTDTFAHAEQVAAERLNHDEDYGFEYQLGGPVVTSLLPPQPVDHDLVQVINEHPGWSYDGPDGRPRATCAGCGETEPLELTRKQLKRDGDDWYSQHLAGVLTRAGYAKAPDTEYALHREGVLDVEYNEEDEKPWDNRDVFLASTRGEPENVLRLERRVGEWNIMKGAGE